MAKAETMFTLRCAYRSAYSSACIHKILDGKSVAPKGKLNHNRSNIRVHDAPKKIIESKIIYKPTSPCPLSTHNNMTISE